MHLNDKPRPCAAHSVVLNDRPTKNIKKEEGFFILLAFKNNNMLINFCFRMKCGHVNYPYSLLCLYRRRRQAGRETLLRPVLSVSVWRRVGPGHYLSDGQGVVVGQGGGAEDYSSILRVCLQHVFSLLPSHFEETPKAAEENK